MKARTILIAATSITLVGAIISGTSLEETTKFLLEAVIIIGVIEITSLIIGKKE